MKNKIFSIRDFTTEKNMLDFINDSDTKEPISVIKENNIYKLYYIW